MMEHSIKLLLLLLLLLFVISSIQIISMHKKSIKQNSGSKAQFLPNNRINPEVKCPSHAEN